MKRIETFGYWLSEDILKRGEDMEFVIIRWILSNLVAENLISEDMCPKIYTKYAERLSEQAVSDGVLLETKKQNQLVA